MDGKFLVNMWLDEALCAGTDTELYFDKYEIDPDSAKETDRMCLSCPVIKECFNEGVRSESFGVWGGMYLNEGRFDNVRNSHKTREVWTRILNLIAEEDSAC